MSPSSFEQKLLASFALSVSALLILAALTWNFSLKAVDATRFVIHTHEVIASLGRVKLQLYLAESGQRGFLISGGQEYLNDYEQAISSLSAEVSQLEKMLVDNAVQRVRLIELQQELANRLALFRQYIELRQQQGLGAVQAAFASGRKVDLRIQAVTTAIENEEQRLLKERQDIESTRATMTAVGFAALLIFMMLAVPLVYIHFRRTGREKQAAAAQAKQLVAVIDSTPDMIAMSSPEGKITYLNRAARAMLELGDKNLSDLKRSEIYPPWALDIVTRIGIPTALAHGYWSGETALTGADGHEIPVSQVIISHKKEDGSVSISTIARNISERKHAEKMLAEAARYDLSSATALAHFNADANRTHALQATLELLASRHNFPASVFYAWHEASHTLQLDLAHGAQPGVQPIFKLGEGMVGAAAASQKLQQIAVHSTENLLLPIQTGFGELPPIALVFCPVIFRGELQGVMALAAATQPHARDLAFLENLSAHLGAALYHIRQLEDMKMLATELRVRNDEIAKKNKEVEQASRMKNEFLANMSHELRTPLNAIIGFSSVIRDGMSGQVNDTTQEYAQDILSSGQHLLALINDILDLSTIESGQMKLEPGLTDGETLAASGLSVLRERAATHRITLAHLVAPPLSAICVDPRKTRQIIFNLLSNAVKFTPDGGKVSLSLQQRQRSEIEQQHAGPNLRVFALPASSFEQFLEISVTDSGIGISEPDLQRLFEPFTQIDASGSRKYEGTGLGLMMVRRLTELQCGGIRVQSREGSGSCFTVWLPLRAPETDPLSQGVGALMTQPLFHSEIL